MPAIKAVGVVLLGEEETITVQMQPSMPLHRSSPIAWELPPRAGRNRPHAGEQYPPPLPPCKGAATAAATRGGGAVQPPPPDAGVRRPTEVEEEMGAPWVEVEEMGVRRRRNWRRDG
uniref:Uncharacterized protein n=1 Tax=Oryza brachyantha TaxID=4533 RepID=J3LP26_ORYBR